VALQIHHLALESNYRLQDQRPNEKMIPSFWQQKEKKSFNEPINLESQKGFKLKT
jgi:hypothetical protein